MKLVVLADEPPQDIAAAEELLQLLSEYKTEIDNHKQAFTDFHKQGKALVNARHYAKDEVSHILHVSNTQIGYTKVYVNR